MPVSNYGEWYEVGVDSPPRDICDLQDENAKLREFATRAYKLLASAHPYTPQQIAEWYDTLEWIDKTARKLGIEVE